MKADKQKLVVLTWLFFVHAPVFQYNILRYPIQISW